MSAGLPNVDTDRKNRVTLSLHIFSHRSPDVCAIRKPERMGGALPHIDFSAGFKIE